MTTLCTDVLYKASSSNPPVSQALLRGAQQLSELFQSHHAALRTEYEERIRALTAERDALLAARQTQTSQPSQDVAPYPDASELEALRAEQFVWRQEQSKHMQERAAWSQERAQYQQERESWALESAKMDAERVQWQGTVARLTQERDTILREREESRMATQHLQDELAGLRHELQVSKTGYGILQGQLASRNASLLAQETRIRHLETVTSGQADAPTEVSSRACLVLRTRACVAEGMTACVAGLHCIPDMTFRRTGPRTRCKPGRQD